MNAKHLCTGIMVAISLPSALEHIVHRSHGGHLPDLYIFNSLPFCVYLCLSISLSIYVLMSVCVYLTLWPMNAKQVCTGVMAWQAIS
jgi:hypothetical protein